MEENKLSEASRVEEEILDIVRDIINTDRKKWTKQDILARYKVSRDDFNYFFIGNYIPTNIENGQWGFDSAEIKLWEIKRATVYVGLGRRGKELHLPAHAELQKRANNLLCTYLIKEDIDRYKEFMSVRRAYSLDTLNGFKRAYRKAKWKKRIFILRWTIFIKSIKSGHSWLKILEWWQKGLIFVVIPLIIIWLNS